MRKFFDAIFSFSSRIPSQALNLIQQAFDDARRLEAEIQKLRDEIARLKQVPTKPEIKKGKDDEPGVSDVTRGGSRKERRRPKKHGIEIHETKVHQKPQGLPPGAKLLARIFHKTCVI